MAIADAARRQDTRAAMRTRVIADDIYQKRARRNSHESRHILAFEDSTSHVVIADIVIISMSYYRRRRDMLCALRHAITPCRLRHADAAATRLFAATADAAVFCRYYIASFFATPPLMLITRR